MLKKFTNKKGFTLMEMLIVVAIIAVLVAIAIPTFSGALTKSKEAADVANVRALYAEWQIKMLNEGEELPDDENVFIGSTKFNYNASGADKLDYTKAADGKSATITYTATKLTGGNGSSDDVFTWTLKPLDIN